MLTNSRCELTEELLSLDGRFVITSVEVALPGGALTLERPRSADELISEADFVRDERLPYWADVWPAAVVLAGAVATLDGRGRRAVELGCGVGLVTIAALRAGFEVLATDYYEDALRFTRRNAARGAGREPSTRLVDWRALPADLGRFDLLLASDVLYERPYAALIADAIVATVARGGVALIADPGRLALGEFVTACEQRSCTVRVRARVPWQDGPAKQTISIHEVRTSGAA